MLLNKAREVFSNPINVIDEEGKDLTKSDIARRHLQSQRWAWVGAEEKNLLHNNRANEYEVVLKSKIDTTNDLIDKGRDDLLSNIMHLRERYDKFDEENIIAIASLAKATSICKSDFLDSHLDLIKSLTKYDDFMYKRLMPYNKGVDRKRMPQIDDNEEKKKELGLIEERIGIGELRPFQKEIDQDKVTSFLASGYSIPTSWIISKDNYIMDGHHRWAATLEIYEPEEQVTVYRSELDAEELFKKLTGVEKGIYVNNFENKKKGRVGQKYGGVEEKKNIVTDKKGNPLTLYHGTPDARFSEIKNSLMGQESDDLTGGSRGVVWFTDNYRTAKSYANPYNAFDIQNAKPDILQRNISLSNPLVVDAKGGVWNKAEFEIDGEKIKGTRQLINFAKKGGYDGLVVKNVYDHYNHFKGEQKVKANMATNYAVFDDKQIIKKSEEDFANALRQIDEGLYKSFVSMPLEEFVKEHKELVDVLLHGNEEEQAQAAASQESELQMYVDKEEAKKLKHYAVAIYQRWSDNKILFLQRTFDDDFHPSVWNLPGGHIDAGETPEQAVKREFKEETNLEVDTCWGARVVTEDNAMIHYYWVIPKEESPIALLDSESQNYAFWDEYEFPMECTILNMESHLLAILHNEEIEKGQQLKIGGGIAGKAGYVQKKVLVNRKGSKPFWQNKWVKEKLETPKLPLKKTMSLYGMAKKVGVSSDVLTGIVGEIDGFMIDGNAYSFDYIDGGFELVLSGIGEKKKGWHVLLKEDTKIEAKPKGDKKELDIAIAENIIKTAYKKGKPLEIQGDKYKIHMFSKTEDYVEFSINGGDKEKEPFKPFSQMLLTELQAKKAAIDKMKQYKSPDVSLKDEDFEVVKKLGGSTGATLVKDKKGVLWVRKGGANKGHRMEELLAINLYKHLGTNVSTSTKLTKDYMYNKYIEGQSLADWKQGKSKEEIRKMHDSISKDFVIDALLGNWDVVGLAEDNIVIDKSGVPIRIDVGGSLRYRAQGEKKKGIDWGASVGEIDTLREMKSNPQSAKVFADVSIGDIMQQVDDLPKDMPSWIDLSVRKTLNERIKWLKEQYEGMPTNLKDIGDLYEVPKDADDDTKEFYSKLNKAIEFTPVDQKVLHLMAANGDEDAGRLANEDKATAHMSHVTTAENLDEYNNKLGIDNRELFAIREYTGGIYQSVNNGIRSLISGEYNLVESGQVVKYKPEFEESAKKAFNNNNFLNAELEGMKEIINNSSEGVGTEAEGHYGVSNIQKLRELNVVIKNTVKKAPNEIELEIAKFYEDHAQGLIDAYEKKGKYEKEIGVYIPSPELKEKYAEVVDLGFASNPANWEDIIAKNKANKGLDDLKEWGDKHAVKMLLIGKLIARGLGKAEKFAGKSNLVNGSKAVSRKLSPSNMNQFLDQHKKGNIVYWPNVSSTSTSFGTWSGSVHTKIMPKGALITKPISQHSGENEHTIKPFPRMRVDEVREEGGKYHVKIQQIG